MANTDLNQKEENERIREKKSNLKMKGKENLQDSYDDNDNEGVMLLTLGTPSNTSRSDNDRSSSASDTNLSSMSKHDENDSRC
mmetsp:Transcript_29836/g.28711  ORF Transcript_29836/g.28711 Transcript_29836/m.28711 type:complete len:83 (+) Transcript_29836:105-353(+)